MDRPQRGFVHDATVLPTPPDEIAFHGKFKDLVARDQAIAVTMRIPGDGVLVTVPV